MCKKYYMLASKEEFTFVQQWNVCKPGVKIIKANWISGLKGSI
jgi:hypothetical protein